VKADSYISVAYIIIHAVYFNYKCRTNSSLLAFVLRHWSMYCHPGNSWNSAATAITLFWGMLKSALIKYSTFAVNGHRIRPRERRYKSSYQQICSCICISVKALDKGLEGSSHHIKFQLNSRWLLLSGFRCSFALLEPAIQMQFIYAKLLVLHTKQNPLPLHQEIIHDSNLVKWL